MCSDKFDVESNLSEWIKDKSDWPLVTVSVLQLHLHDPCATAGFTLTVSILQLHLRDPSVRVGADLPHRLRPTAGPAPGLCSYLLQRFSLAWNCKSIWLFNYFVTSVHWHFRKKCKEIWTWNLKEMSFLWSKSQLLVLHSVDIL